MSMTRTFVNRPITVVIVFVLLIGLGIYAFSDLAVDLYPEIDPPILLVFSNYNGAGPEEVEKSVTRPLEGALTNVSNIEEMTSISSEGSTMVMISFTWGTNMAEASNDVRDKLEFAKDFMPDDATTPQIFKFDPSMMPVMYMIVTGERTPEELRKVSEDMIVPRLEQVEGVAMASVSGGREQVVRVEFSQNRLDAYSLSMTQTANILRGQNMQVSAGSLTDAGKNYLLRTSGEYSSIEQIKNTVIGYKGGNQNPLAPLSNAKMIRLGDVANVFSGYRDEQMSIFINGKPGVYITVQKQSGMNSVKTADNVYERLEDLKNDIPYGINVNVIQDTTKIIRASLNQVSSSAIVGALFAVLILFIFLRSLKSTIIIALSIPVSIIITLMAMYFFNLTLNIMTLAGLALGIGMLVDNSIVILENIYRYREKGAKLHSAAILGSQEMINAITASTLTTICVFAPLALFRSQLEMMGELFSGLAFTVVISLLSSLLVAIVLVPVLSSKYLPLTTRRHKPLRGFLKKLDDSVDSFFRGLESAYRKALTVVLRKKAVTLLVTFAILAASGASAWFFLGKELMPQQEGDTVELSVELPLGTKLEETHALMNSLAHTARREIDGEKHVIVTAGERGFMGFLGATVEHKGSLMITLPSFEDRVDTVTDIKRKLRKYFHNYAGAVFSFSSRGGNFTSASRPIDIVIKSENIKKAKVFGDTVVGLINEHLSDTVIEPTLDVNDGLPQYEIFIDRDKAYFYKLNIYAIGQEIKAANDGIVASRYRTGGSEYDILCILEDKDRDNFLDLDKIFIMNNYGQKIRLSDFCHYERTSGPVDIRREDQQRVIHLTADAVDKDNLEKVEASIRDVIQQHIPSDNAVTYQFSGEFQEQMEYFGKLSIILLVSIFLVFGVMASQFESFLDPIIIFFTILLVPIGVVGLYLLTGETLSAFTIVGIVMLSGIVVNNGIVLVDYMNLLRKRGMKLYAACIEAAANRFRPVLMTTLTTILGLIPMSFFQGEGAELVQPIGRTVVGGLAANTVLTLFVVPVMYVILNHFNEKKRLSKVNAAVQYSIIAE